MVTELKNMTQDSFIQSEVMRMLKQGGYTKKDIFDSIEKNTTIPRPTIRRSAGKLREELTEYLEILNIDKNRMDSKKNEIN